MSLKPNIKQVLAVLNKAIKQTPLDKQPLLLNKVIRVVQKYEPLDPQLNGPKYLKELQFNLNFIRLSFPHLDYSPPQETHSEERGDIEEEARAKSEFFQLQNKEEMLKFVDETAKALKGVRQEVQFSNWSTGNLDPEDLNRHKQLLRRQYFKGEFWKGKQRPQSPTASYLMNMMQEQSEKRHEHIEVDTTQAENKFEVNPRDRWEKVKR